MNRLARTSALLSICLVAGIASCTTPESQSATTAAPLGSTSAAVKSAASIPSPSSAAPAAAAAACPALGWSEGLIRFLAPDARVPTTEPTTDCGFHEWSWETFVWATALDKSGTPRFMTLPTVDDLVSIKPDAEKEGVRPLRLANRALKPHGANGAPEVAGAIVEADGNMMVAPNGYPVLASVHMNPSYFKTAKKNLIVDGGYQKNPDQDAYFAPGDAIFKATWMRLDAGQKPPVGAYTTQADVPILTIDKKTSLVVTTGKTTQATVALVGLHVVGMTDGHPEFLWGTFEQNLNNPQVPDNTFTTAGTDPKGYTFYAANTSYANVNTPNSAAPATLTFDEKTQRFSPITSAVLENKTGGETNSPDGPANIASLNTSSQRFLQGQPGNEALFANYSLIGTVWMKPNTYVTTNPSWKNLGSADAVGSVNLANSTAETFVQVANDSVLKNVTNCFSCHDPGSYNFQSSPPKLASRRIAISHVLAVSSPYAVPNQILVKQ